MGWNDACAHNRDAARMADFRSNRGRTRADTPHGARDASAARHAQLVARGPGTTPHLSHPTDGGDVQRAVHSGRECSAPPHRTGPRSSLAACTEAEEKAEHEVCRTWPDDAHCPLPKRANLRAHRPLAACSHRKGRRTCVCKFGPTVHTALPKRANPPPKPLTVARQRQEGAAHLRVPPLFPRQTM